MYELVKIDDRNYYIKSPTNVGIVVEDNNEVCLIDSGNDESAGRRIRKLCDNNGWKIRAIFNTHSHADHIGGNSIIERQTGCKIYASETECEIIRHPIMNPSMIYGANPIPDMLHKFLLAQSSDAKIISPDVLPDGMEILSLSGHSFNMIGYRTKENVVYLADSLSSEATLEKYGICYIYDIEKFLDTLEYVKTIQADLYIPSHAEASRDISALIQLNIDKVHEIGSDILKICNTPITFESLLQSLFEHYGLKMSAQQYALVGSTVRSYLSWLCMKNAIEVYPENNMLLWKSK